MGGEGGKDSRAAEKIFFGKAQAVEDDGEKDDDGDDADDKVVLGPPKS